MSDTAATGEAARTLNMLIAALGGEGGGVLTNWLIEVAERSGWHCQSTSLAGVAQRTGATIYYLEFMPRIDGRPPPVMSLFPAQGDIDLAVTSEIAEAGRMLSRGFISPERTVLISSDHRVYGITEKSATTDGSVDAAMIRELAGRYAQRFVHFDMAELVQRQGTVISAALFGAIAGSAALPFEREAFTAVLAGGRGATANLAAFDEAAARAAAGPVVVVEPVPAEPAFVLPEARTEFGRRLLPRIAALPVSCHEVLYRAAIRLIEYQDSAYAEEFLERVERLAGKGATPGTLCEAARYLALWMAFEDIPRVAQLKVRPEREREIREEVQAAPGQLLSVREFFHPRVEEVAALLPAALGRALLASPALRRAVNLFLGPRTLRTDRVHVQLLLRLLAGLRRLRRHSYGFAEEWAMIERWYGALLEAHDAQLRRELAECGRMVKGYGATRLRTTSRLMAILDAVQCGSASSADTVRSLREAAMSGDDPAPFEAALKALGVRRAAAA